LQSDDASGGVDLHEVGGIYLDSEQPGERNGLPGYNRAYFEQRFPHLHLPDDIGEAGWWNRPFEPVEDSIPRARRFVNELFARHGGTGDGVVVVSHGDFYNLTLAVLLNLPVSEQRWFSLNNTGVSRFIFTGEHIAITYMNRVDFLPRELVT
jgi:broad specificity phosphatase PhoE